MTTTLLSNNPSPRYSWQDETKYQNQKASNNLDTTNNSDVAGLRKYAVSADGFVRSVVTPNPNSDDLNNIKNTNNNTASDDKIGDNGSGSKQTISGVSLLAGKYLLLPTTSPQNTRKINSSPKTETTCLNIQTKEQFTCKVVPRNPNGLTIMASYHRLEECSDFVNQVVEAILTPKVLYLIMPKNYGNVHSYLLEKRTLEEAEAANIFAQMVQAVQQCHSKGVILRDIKMGRFVFMDKDKTVVKLESLEDATLLVDPRDDSLDDKHGCPNYVSPEKAESLKSNLKYPGKATDVWCLGVVLFTMLTGRYPFNDQNHSRLLNKIRAGNYTIPPGLSSSVASLIKALLKKTSSERPKCCEILRSPWILRHCVPVPSPRNLPDDRKESCNPVQIPIPPRSVFSDQVVPDT